MKIFKNVFGKAINVNRVARKVDDLKTAKKVSSRKITGEQNGKE